MAKETQMTTLMTPSFPTTFGMYAACDKATYKKMKRLNHLLHQCAQPWANRWSRSQCRLPQNRYFWFKGPGLKTRKMVKDSWVFEPFWTIRPLRSESGITPTPLYMRFLESYRAARYPVADPEQVKPLTLSDKEIDLLLGQMSIFASTFK